MTKQLYKKLAEARVMLQEAGVKKTGYNAFSKFEYFQLSDFLPEVNRIFQKLGLCSHFTMDVTTAVLTIYDTEEDASLTFTSPTAEAGIKGASSIQQLGGVITYMRRYLWLMAMEITEADTVDALPEEKKKPGKALPDFIPISKAAQDRIHQLYTDNELTKMLAGRGVKSLDELSADVGAKWIEHRTGGIYDKSETF